MSRHPIVARWPRPRRNRRLRGEHGMALATVMIFVAVAGVLGTTVTVVATAGLSNSSRDRAATAAQATSDAGVAEAMAYIRSNGLGQLTCAEHPDSELPTGTDLTATPPVRPCASNTNPWANDVVPKVVVPGGAGSAPSSCAGATRSCYQVWIGTLQTYQSPQGPPGDPSSTPARPALLRVHSTGFSGTGPGARSLAVDLTVTPARFPIGLFGQTVDLNGNPNIAAESVFAAGDVNIKCPTSGLDPEYNIPAAVHAAGTITYGPGSKCGVNGTIHPPVCNAARPFDQDSRGGPLTSGDGCYKQGAVAYPGSNPDYPTTSFFGANDLATYGYRPGGLSPAEYEALKAQAQALGTYYPTNPNPLATLNTLATQGVRSPVVYYDFPSGAPGIVSLDHGIPAYYTRTTGAAVGCAQHSVTVIVRNGDVSWRVTDGVSPVVAVFAPEGSYTGEGDVAILGTMFAHSISMLGTQSFQLDPCYVADPPGGVLSLTVDHYRQVDTGNIQ